MKNKTVAYTAKPDLNKFINPKPRSFNPSAKEFIERYNPSIIGLYWAGYWRLYVIILGISLIIVILSELIN